MIIRDSKGRFMKGNQIRLGSKRPDVVKRNQTKEFRELLKTKLHYSKYGFKVLIIWENELEYPNRVLKKIRVFENG